MVSMDFEKAPGTVARVDGVSDESDGLNEKLGTRRDQKDMDRLGKLQQLRVSEA